MGAGGGGGHWPALQGPVLQREPIQAVHILRAFQDLSKAELGLAGREIDAASMR